MLMRTVDLIWARRPRLFLYAEAKSALHPTSAGQEHRPFPGNIAGENTAEKLKLQTPLKCSVGKRGYGSRSAYLPLCP